MTRKEKVIISAYTGQSLVEFEEIRQYIEEKLGRKVEAYELAYARTWDEIRDAVRDDFMRICEIDTPEE